MLLFFHFFHSNSQRFFIFDHKIHKQSITVGHYNASCFRPLLLLDLRIFQNLSWTGGGRISSFNLFSIFYCHAISSFLYNEYLDAHKGHTWQINEATC